MRNAIEGPLSGRVVAITGAGRGVGRGYALEYARLGADVVINDLGVTPEGGQPASGPASEVVAEIEATGGRAVANLDDIADEAGAGRLIQQALDSFGRLDVLINNAGILRDRTIVNMSFEEWDSVVRVHLRGTFAPMKFASQYWRDQSKQGAEVDARIINTTSSSGLYPNPGQANYASAKAGIAALTVIASKELIRYGVTVNAVYPTALSRLTTSVIEKVRAKSTEDFSDFDPLNAENIAPVVAWLGSPAAKHVTGRVFGVRGGRVTLAEGWQPAHVRDLGRRLDFEDAGALVSELLAQTEADQRLPAGP